MREAPPSEEGDAGTRQPREPEEGAVDGGPPPPSRSGSEPPLEVLARFAAPGPPSPLAGGEGRAWRAGDLVLKPCDDPIEWEWLAEHVPTVRTDVRLAPPVPTIDGEWLAEGWCAQPLLAGAHAERWLDVLAVARKFHAAVRHLPRPAFIDNRTHAWSVGDRVAWDEAAPPIAHPLLGRMLAIRRPIHAVPQVIHGDLTENVLFADGLPPAVIDVTPYWRPAGCASAIVVGDAIRWRDADPAPLLDATADIEGFPQLLVRAIIFRLVTSLVFDVREVASFEPVVDVAEDLVSRSSP
jgi:uncharacterized protein (TIGR02569 family)